MLAAGSLAAPGMACADRIQLNEALIIAATTHPSVAARRSDREAAGQRLEAAEWGRYPSLSAQSGSDQLGRRSTTTRIEQPLWTGGQITGRIDGAGAGVRGAEASVIESQQEIMTRVATAFTEFGRVRARQSAAASNVTEHERLAALIGRRVKSQVSPASDAVMAQARLAQARADLSQLEALEARARATLEQALDRKVGEIDLPAKRRLPFSSLTATTDAAVNFSPALRRLTASEEAAAAEVVVRRGATMPRVVARYDHTFGDSTLSGDRIFVAMEYQLGAGLSSFASVREAEALRQATLLAREAARRDLVDAVSADWGDFEALGKQATDLQSQVESTTEVFDSFVRQYSVGRKTWIDVLNAQREASQARYALADAEWGSLRAAVRLQLATGEITATSLLSSSTKAR
jgi:adhesin transport system outer membrane protein